MRIIRLLSLCGLLCLLTALPAPAQNPAPANPELLRAVDQLAARKYDEGIETLKKLLASEPSEPAFYSLATAFMNKGNVERAAATFEDGIAQYPLSARMYNGAAVAYERQLKLKKAIEFYRKAVALEPSIAFTGGGRYEPEFDAIYIPVLHDHRGANACSGRLYVDGEKMHFVVYHVVSGWGLGNDDSFESPLSNLAEVEIDRKQGLQWADYAIIALLTNQSGPRRRIASGDQSRVDLKFIFRQPIKGYRGDPWSKPEIKFFFVEPEVGEQFVKFLESTDVKTYLRK
jgi:tetratricopeptide (TPR) repeat protein